MSKEDLTHLARLEERVHVQEQLLQVLLKRQVEVKKGLLDVRTQSKQCTDRLDELEEKKSQLEKRKQKHVEIKTSIQQKLSSAAMKGVISVPNIRRKRVFPVSSKLEPSNDKPRDSVDKRPLETAEVNDLGPDGSSEAFDIHPMHETLSFLPPKDTQTMLPRILEVCTLETLSMDEIYKDGHHRRIAVSDSCLWFSLCRGGEVQAPLENETPNRFDPNVALCPYEMSGECADVYCLYQHLRPRTVEALPRELIRLPELTLLDKASSLAALEGSGKKLTPVVPMKDKHEEPAMKELRSLASKFSTVESMLAPVSDKENPTTAELGSNNTKPEESKPDAMDFSADFISLPPLPDDESEGSSDVPGPFDVKSETSLEPTFWWQVSTEPHEHSLSDDLTSLNNWLRIRCGLIVNTEQGTLDIERATEASRDVNPTLLGRVLHGVEVALHAGEYKTASRICDEAEKLVSTLARKPTRRVLDLALRVGRWALESCTKPEDTGFSQRTIGDRFIRDFGARAPLLLASQALQLLSLHNEMSFQRCEALLESIKQIYISGGQTNVDLGPPLGEREGERWLFETSYVLRETLQGRPGSGGSISWNDSDEKRLLDLAFREARRAKLKALSEKTSDRQFFTLAVRAFHALTRTWSSTSRSQAFDDTRAALEFATRRPHSAHNLCFVPAEGMLVALACWSRRYQAAQIRLEKALGSRSPWSFSDLLWSQMISLRMLLPCAPGWTLSSQATLLPKVIRDEHMQLTGRIGELGVMPRHLVLNGDGNLIKFFSTRREIPDAQETLTSLRAYFAYRRGDPPVHRIRLDSFPLLSRGGADIAASQISFPRSVMIGGRAASEMSFCDCKITALPLTFGHHFPSLLELTLTFNDLTELPESIGSLGRLEVLDVSSNKLKSLPETLGKCIRLKVLKANNNRISSLPATLTNCSELEEVHLRNNLLVAYPSLAVLQLSKLKLLDIDCNSSGQHAE